jgi:hypothetical protein
MEIWKTLRVSQFAYGNTLFSIDSNFLVVYTLTTQVPTLTAIVPITEPWQWTLNNGVLYVIQTVPPGGVSPTLPIDLYDMTTGTAIHNHYELPQPQGGAGQLWGISGNVITPGVSSLYLAVQGVTMQLDNTVPQNSIEPYYPPAALSNATQITDAVSRNGFTRNPKVGLLSRGLVANGHGPDRFGVVRQGRGAHSGKR